MEDMPASRILNAWVALEETLRAALPVCSVAPPTQPAELLSALRINHRIGADEEEEIMLLRGIRNRIATSPEEPPQEEAARYEASVARLRAGLVGSPPGVCRDDR